MPRNYKPGTPVILRGADGVERCLTVEHVTEGQVTFRESDGSRLVKSCRTDIALRYALCGYRVVEPPRKLVFDKSV